MVFSDTVRPEFLLSCRGPFYLHMKKAQLEKSKGLKLVGQMQKAPIPGRFAEGAAALPDRREQRKLDQAAGLVPYAVKLTADLVRQLREMAERDGGNINELTERLIKAGLAASPAATPVAAPATKAPAAKAPAVKKAAATKAVADDKPVAKKAAAKKVAVKKTATKKS
jgi:hypothetical protein